MKKPQRFQLTKDHLKLLREAYVEWDFTEFGAPGIDPKRPYGNFDALVDIAEILGVDADKAEEYEEELYKTHQELQHALQIILLYASTGIRLGVYEKKDEYDSRSWKFVG